MARQRPRKPFPTATKREKFDQNSGYEGNERSGVFGFLSDRGVRETIESVLVAVILALLFRTFEAEAFVIPTGSMAPSLQGQHRDINCDACGYLYQTSASEESSTQPPNRRRDITHTYCPICRHRTVMNSSNWDHTSNNGDRILVNKFVYDFSEPKRFDVIVFKNPNNGKQNYIKRLIGLPGEKLFIENGDIFQVVSSDDGTQKIEIVRKPSEKLRAMLQDVDDTDFIPQAMHDVGWPLRWQQWHGQRDADGGWQATVDSAKPKYSINAGEKVEWLQYRHLVPKLSMSESGSEDWENISNQKLPTRMSGDSPAGTLITDYYCYNDREWRSKSEGSEHDFSYAMHWVGDLAVDCWTKVESDTGKLKLQLVEGGAKFICTIDVSSGEASLSSDQSTVQFVDAQGNSVELPKAQTNLKGTGEYRILFANIDDQIHLSINNRYVNFDAATFVRSDQTMPRFFPNDDENLGDAEPIGIGAENLKMEITRLKVLRDIYYTSPTGMEQDFIGDETKFAGRPTHRNDIIFRRKIQRVWDWLEDPTSWESKGAARYFQDRFRENRYFFDLAQDEFLPMGDNSPSSLDGRVWDGPKNVNRDMLIGRALFIYWPHALNSPVPYFPNFQKMKFIR